MLDLHTGVAQAREANHRIGPKLKLGVGGQSQQVNASGGDVFAHVARSHHMASCTQLVKQLALQQVHLTQVGLARIARHARAVLNRLAAVCVTLNAQAGEQRDALERILGKFVDRTEVDGENVWAHVRRFLASTAQAAPRSHT
jgi:hypothetical protein